MNPSEINTFASYLSSNGIISTKELYLLSSQSAKPSQKTFILSIAQLIKSKSISSNQNFSLNIYNQFISNDNTTLVKMFKKLFTIYQRSRRLLMLNRFHKWKLHSIGLYEGSYQNFNFTIARETVHERLFNYQKIKESSRRRLEKDVYATEAEKCTFIPTINHDYVLNGRSRARSNKNINLYTNSIDFNTNEYSKNNQQYYSSTNPNTARANNKSPTYTCTTGSTGKINTKSAISGNIRRPPSTNSSLINNLIRTDTNITKKKYLSSQPSYNSLLIPNCYNNSSSTSSKSNILSNRAAKTPKYCMGDYIGRASSREGIGKLSQDLSESINYKHPKRNNNKYLSLKSSDNSSITNIQDKVTHYISHENKSKQISFQESHTNSKVTKKSMDIPKDIYPIQGTYVSGYIDFKNAKSTIPLITNKSTNPQKDTTIKYINKSSKENGNSESNDDQYNTSNAPSTKGNNNAKAKNSIFDHITNTNTNEPIKINKNLKISSGVVSEYFPEMENYNIQSNYNCNYLNQITLQTISDSKLYEIANNYITTDESLDKYKCVSSKKQSHKKYEYKKTAPLNII